MRIGIPEEYWVEGTQPGVVQAVREDIEKLRELGAIVEPVSLPHTKYGVAAYYIIAPAEASANLARYDGVKYGYSYRDTDDMWEALEKTRQYGFGQEVKRRIMLGTYALSSGYYDAYYKQAEKVRSLITQDFTRAFERFDVLASPASPIGGIQAGRDIRPVPDVLAGCLHHPGQPVGYLRRLYPRRLQQRPARRFPTAGQLLRRRCHPARRQRLRASDRLSQTMAESSGSGVIKRKYASNNDFADGKIIIAGIFSLYDTAEKAQKLYEKTHFCNYITYYRTHHRYYNAAAGLHAGRGNAGERPGRNFPYGDADADTLYTNTAA